jgi:hypothetical protein
MPVLSAEIQLAGLRAQCPVASYCFDQGTDYAGRPNTTVHVGLLTVVLTGEVAAWPVWEALMFDPYRRESGHLIFFQGEDQTFKRITFYNAACVFYECRFDARGREGRGSFETELRFSAATLDVQGQRVEAHSTIPWATDAATSWRALTKPPEPAPWLGLVGSPFGLPKLPPPMPPGPTLLGAALEQAAAKAGQVLGSPAARVAGAALGTVALVLEPANDPNAPGYEPEKPPHRAARPRCLPLGRVGTSAGSRHADAGRGGRVYSFAGEGERCT